MLNHKGTQILTDQELTLRPFTLDDADDMFNNWANDEKVCEFVTWKPHGTVDATKEYLTSVVSSYPNANFYNWAITRNGELIGNISIVLQSEMHDTCEVGYVLAPKYWSQGIMTRCLKLITCYMMFEVGYHRVTARHDVQNFASALVCQKCGMIQEGLSRQAARRGDDRFVDVMCCAILRSDFKRSHIQDIYYGLYPNNFTL